MNRAKGSFILQHGIDSSQKFMSKGKHSLVVCNSLSSSTVKVFPEVFIMPYHINAHKPYNLFSDACFLF
ncbi:MAG: hypothetical protein ABDH16_06650 [Thermodesulfovibrionaceae bacterium]